MYVLIIAQQLKYTVSPVLTYNDVSTFSLDLRRVKMTALRCNEVSHRRHHILSNAIVMIHPIVSSSGKENPFQNDDTVQGRARVLRAVVSGVALRSVVD